MSWPSRCTRCQPQFNTAYRGSQHITKSGSMGAFNAVSDFQILRWASSSSEGVNHPPCSNEARGRHTEPLAGRAFEGNTHLDVFVRTQECCIITRFNEIKVEVHPFEVFAVHVDDRYGGRLRFVLVNPRIGYLPCHGLTGRGVFAVKGSGDFDAMMNGKPCAFAALTSFQRGGFVNREEKGDVSTTAKGSGGHPSKRRGIG